MSKKNEVIKKFKNLISSLKKHNKHYYVEDSPRILDYEYDLLKKEILKLEENYPYLKKIETIKNIVGLNLLINLKDKTFTSNVVIIKCF